MKITELKSRLEKFHDDLAEHYQLWSRSLDKSFPDYPISNHEVLRVQSNNLSRQLGTLRLFIEQLAPTTFMGSSGSSWDAYDSAVANDVAARKGPSIEGILPQLQQILGKLESFDENSEFQMKNSKRDEQQINNYIHVEQMTNSQIQQGTHRSSQSQVMSQDQLQELIKYLQEVRQKLPEMSLSVDERQEAEAQLETLEAQTKSSKPRINIIKLSLAALKELLLHTGGALAAHELIAHMPKFL